MDEKTQQANTYLSKRLILYTACLPNQNNQFDNLISTGIGKNWNRDLREDKQIIPSDGMVNL